MQLNAYLNFKGDCAEAFKFYERTFGGKITFQQTFGDSPMKGDVPPEWSGKLMHVTLEVGPASIMGSDAPPDRYLKPQGFSVSLTVGKPEEADRIFEALATGGTVQMPIQETFWAPRFGMVMDRFGIPWAVNCDPAAA
jgi:PhnB protein